MRRWIFGALATFGVTAAIAMPLLTGPRTHNAKRPGYTMLLTKVSLTVGHYHPPSSH